MALVALVAADCVALRVFLVPERLSPLFVLGLLPMLNLLLPGLLLATSQLRRQGACHAFLAGFEIFGWAAIAVFTCFCLSPSAFDTGRAYLQAVLTPLERLHESWGLTYDPDSIFQMMYGTAVSSAALSLPLLITGLSGGCLAWASGVTLARSGRPIETGPGAEAVNSVYPSCGATAHLLLKLYTRSPAWQESENGDPGITVDN
jgi:hypothetical protein